MRNTILIVTFFTLNFSVFGQEKRTSLAESNIFINANYENKINDYKYIGIREFLKDTIIKEKEFKKICFTTFKDYSKEKMLEYYFESFENSEYEKLDQNLKTIHKVSFKPTKTQQGILFYKEDNISIEYVDTRNYFPRDSLIANEKTPRKYYLTNKTETYIVVRPDLKVVELSAQGINYTKHLLGDIFTDISKGLKNTTPISNSIDLVIGDEIQLFYRRKWYNDSTQLAEYEDKQFKNIKYVSDTLIEGHKALNLEINGYNYLSGQEENESFPVILKDSGYYVGQQFTKLTTFKPELKIIEQDSLENYISLQTYTYENIGNKKFPKVTQYYSGSLYRYYLLPYFPMPFIEFGNVQGIITYVKQDGEEHGKKRERTKKTDEPNIRKIRTLSKKEIELTYFLPKSAKVEWLFYSTIESEPKLIKVTESKQGENIIVLKTPKLKNKGNYQIQMEIYNDNGKSVITHGFRAKIK